MIRVPLIHAHMPEWFIVNLHPIVLITWGLVTLFWAVLVLLYIITLIGSL